MDPEAERRVTEELRSPSQFPYTEEKGHHLSRMLHSTVDVTRVQAIITEGHLHSNQDPHPLRPGCGTSDMEFAKGRLGDKVLWILNSPQRLMG